MASRLPNFYRRDTKVYNLVFTDAAGAAIKITNAIIVFTMKRRPSDFDDDAVIQKKAVITNGPGGLATLTLTKTETDIDIGKYHYDIQYTSGTGAVTTLIASTIEVLQETTITGLT